MAKVPAIGTLKLPTPRALPKRPKSAAQRRALSRGRILKPKAPPSKP